MATSVTLLGRICPSTILVRAVVRRASETCMMVAATWSGRHGTYSPRSAPGQSARCLRVGDEACRSEGRTLRAPPRPGQLKVNDPVQRGKQGWRAIEPLLDPGGGDPSDCAAFTGGAVAEWSRRGLQILVHRFDSGPRLHVKSLTHRMGGIAKGALI